MNSLQVGELISYRVEEKNLAKFSDTFSVRADGLCIGSPRLVGGGEGGKFKQARVYFCTTLYSGCTT